MADETLTPAQTTQPTSTTTPTSIGSILWNQNEVTPQQVYSANNVQTALTQPTARPDLSDPFGVYDFYMNSPEIQNARSTSQKYYQDLLGVRQTARTQNQAIENLPQALNVIRGEQAVAGNQAALRENAIADSLQASQAYLNTLTTTAQNRYNIALEERGKLQELIAQTGGKAKINYTDTFESAVKKAQKYTEKLEKKAKKEAKSAAKAQAKSDLKSYAKKLQLQQQYEKEMLNIKASIARANAQPQSIDIASLFGD